MAELLISSFLSISPATVTHPSIVYVEVLVTLCVKHLCCEERMADLGQLSLEKRRLKGNVTDSYIWWVGVMGPGSFHGAQQQEKGWWALNVR